MKTVSNIIMYRTVCQGLVRMHICLMPALCILVVLFMGEVEVCWMSAMESGLPRSFYEHDGMLIAQADGPVLTNPDWVPPSNRGRYPGYQIHEDAKKNSESWKYSTNRPGGKIKGSGTVKYKDYRSVTKQTKPDSGGGTGGPSGK